MSDRRSWEIHAGTMTPPKVPVVSQVTVSVELLPLT